MHCFSGNGCSEFPESMHFCIGILTHIPLLLLALVCALTINSTEVHANEYDTWAQSIVDSQGHSTSGGTDDIAHGVSYTRTGYLCYLLDKNGNAVPGTGAVALKSPGFDYYTTSTHWIVESRKGGYKVNSFISESKEAPWGVTPWDPPAYKGAPCPTNEPDIKRWFKDVDEKGIQNSAKFVKDNWGKENNDIVLKFGAGEYYLVIETLMHFQYSVAAGGVVRDGEEVFNSLMYRIWNANIMVLMSDAPESLRKAYHNGKIGETILRGELDAALQKLYDTKGPSHFEKRATGRSFVGAPVVGTVPNLIDYKTTIGTNTDVFDSYLNKVAPFAEMINSGDIGEEIGFIAWTGATGSKITNAQVKGSNNAAGLATIVISAGETSINTYDPAQGSPGKAEDPNPGKVGTKTIVKGYYTEDEKTGTKTSDGVFTQPNTTNKINIMEEPEYQLVSWNISTSEPTEPDPAGSWISTPKGGITPTTVTLESEEKTLYVLLKKVEAEELEIDGTWVINESEITKSVQSGDKTTNEILKVTLPDLESCNGHSKQVEVEVDAYITCEQYNANQEYLGHSDRCSVDGCSGHKSGTTTKTETETYKCTSWSFDGGDKKFSLLTKNTNEDNATTSKHVLAKDSNFKTKNEKTTDPDERTSTAEEDYDTKGYNYKFVIHRLNKDKLSFLEYEPSPDNLTTIQTLGNQFNIKTLSEKSSKTRKTAEYAETLKLILEYDSANSPDKKTSAKGNEGCTPSSSDITSTDKIEFEGDVVIKTYSGISRVPDTTLDTSRIMTIGVSGFTTTSGRMVESGTSISFNPFIQMTYETLEGSKQNVYIISEWIRQIIPNDYAEISWNKSPTNNLRITSNQWSTHADALRLKNEIGASSNSMLPGGAVYSLDMKTNSGGTTPQTVQIKTYQTIVEGKARENSSLKNDSTSLTESTAILEHQSFVDSVASTLEGTSVEMWVNKDTGASTAWSSGGIKAYPGANISSLNNGSSTASTDSKYYLVPDVDNNKNASRSDLDTNTKHLASKYHRVWSDTHGNIRYTSGNSLEAVTGVGINGGSVILTKGQDVSALSGAAKPIDTRTKLITKYVAAVERNTGNDSTADWAKSDGHWYNEAFYGIIVVEQTSQIEVKFHATDLRTTVITKFNLQKHIQCHLVWLFLNKKSISHTIRYLKYRLVKQ